MAKESFPNLNAEQIEAAAAVAYNQAATNLLVTVLRTARAVRPSCHWCAAAHTIAADSKSLNLG